MTFIKLLEGREREVALHALGLTAYGGGRRRRWAYRNRFAAGDDGEDRATWDRMESAGLARGIAVPPALGSGRRFALTQTGMLALGSDVVRRIPDGILNHGFVRTTRLVLPVEGQLSLAGAAFGSSCTVRLPAKIPKWVDSGIPMAHPPKHDAPYFDAYCGAFKSDSNPRGMSGEWCWWTRDDRPGPGYRCPIPVPGSRVWVPENMLVDSESRVAVPVMGRSSHDIHDMLSGGAEFVYAAHLPRWAARLEAVITDIRIEGASGQSPMWAVDLRREKAAVSHRTSRSWAPKGGA